MTSRKTTLKLRALKAWPEVSAGLVGLVLLSYAWPVAERGMWEIKSAVLLALIAGLSSWAFARGAGTGDKAFSPAAAPLLALSTWMFISTAWSADRVAGFEQAFMFFWVAVLLFSPSTRISPAILACLVAGMALVEAGAGALESNGGTVSRINGTFVGATHHAALIICGYSVAVVYAVSARRVLVSSAGIAVSFLLLASASMSGSRAVIPAVFAVLVALILAKPSGFSGRKAAILVVASVAAIFTPDGVAGRISDQVSGLEPLPLGRMDLWGACIRMLADSPITGTGMGGFADMYFAFRPLSLEKLSADYAHCEPLQLACETGLIGLGLGIWAVVCLWKMKPQLRGRELSVPASVLPLVPLAVFSLVDFPLRVPVLAFLAVACLAGFGQGMRKSGPIGKRKGFLPLAGFILVSFVMVLWFSAGHMAGLWYIAGAKQSNEGKNIESLRSFESALSVFPFHAESIQAIAEQEKTDSKARVDLAKAGALRPAWINPVEAEFERALNENDLQGARLALEKADRIDPLGLPAMLMRVREAYLLRQEWGTAEKGLARADRVWPNNLDVWLAKARMLEAKGDYKGCKTVLRKIIRVFPGNIMVKEWLERLP